MSMFRRGFTVLFSFLLAFSLHATRAEVFEVLTRDCGASRVMIWIEGTDGSCGEISTGRFACSESSGGDYAEMDCQSTSPCVRTEIGAIAGCLSTTNSNLPPHSLMEPLHTVKCSNGKTFDLKGREGDKCDKIVEGHSDGSVSTVGGKCSQVKNGSEEISSSTDCNSCGPSTSPGDCTER